MNGVIRKPHDFDWVSARAQCTIVSIFEKLKMLIAQDIETMNHIRAKDSLFFKLVEAGSTRFSVIGEAFPAAHKSVVFSLSNSEILAASSNGLIFRATVTLCNDGECRAKIGEREYDIWQLRKGPITSAVVRQ